MRNRWRLMFVCMAASLFTAVPRTSAAENPAGGAEFFEKSVRPLLAEHCFECHGAKKQKAGLRLDSREAMLEGGDSGPAIVPGHPEQSLVAKVVKYQDEPRMPP